MFDKFTNRAKQVIKLAKKRGTAFEPQLPWHRTYSAGVVEAGSLRSDGEKSSKNALRSSKRQSEKASFSVALANSNRKLASVEG